MTRLLTRLLASYFSFASRNKLRIGCCFEVRKRGHSLSSVIVIKGGKLLTFAHVDESVLLSEKGLDAKLFRFVAGFLY